MKRTWAEVSLPALGHNIREVRRILPPDMGLVSVVKADAYGHGLKPVVEYLNTLGVQGYAVANPLEGAEVRSVGVQEPVIIFGPIFPHDLECILSNNLSISISSGDEVDMLQQALAGVRKSIRVHLKIDTGMGRMGVPFIEAPLLLKRIQCLKNLKLEGIYTHLASAGEQDDFTALQRSRFSAFVAGLPSISGLMIHADNSAGASVFDLSGPWNAVRLGLMQYGCEPYALKVPMDLKPVLSAHARVGLVKALPKGSTISYGGTHRLTRDSRVAVVTVGYADGLSRQVSNRGSMLIRGQRCPILGRICMDLTVLDVTDHPESVHCGDRVTWIGTQGQESIRAETLSVWSDSIPWECLCALSKRVPRVYIN